MKTSFKIVLSLAITSLFIFAGWAYYIRCDYRTFTLKITESGVYDETTSLFKGKGIYTYPPTDAGNELIFTMPKKFSRGQFIDQCLNLNLHNFDSTPAVQKDK